MPPGGGKTFAVRDGYHQRYMGLEVSATKRLSNRWMARFGFSTNDWREYFDDPSKAILDPTRAPVAVAGVAVRRSAGGRRHGRRESSTGSGKSGIYMVAPSYQFVANGLYEAIWGISVGANLVATTGLRRAVLPEQRRDRRSARPQDGAAGARTSTTSGCRP